MFTDSILHSRNTQKFSRRHSFTLAVGFLTTVGGPFFEYRPPLLALSISLPVAALAYILSALAVMPLCPDLRIAVSKLQLDFWL